MGHLKNYLLPTCHKIKKGHFTVFFILLLVPCITQSQDHNKRLKKADEIFKAFLYIDARAIYLDVAKKGYVSPTLYQKLADAFYLTGELENSLEWYEKLIQSYPENLDPEYLFKYAQSLKSVERYQEADEVMEQFYKITKNDKRARSYINKRDYLDFIEMQSGKFDVFSLNINSKKSEYAPSFTTQNQIIFASSRSKVSKDSKSRKQNKMPFFDLFSSNITGDGINLEQPIKLKGKINTRFHESSTSISKDGKTMYFSRNNSINNKVVTSKKGIVKLKLYKATFEENKWDNEEELPFSSNEYSVSHPSLSADGKKLYFASDMPGTLGKSDLYVVDILSNGTYGKPKNLGNNINTEGRETFPFITDTGNLYFSSDGHVGLGGLDVFIVTPEGPDFSTAYNVGKPINSPKDDFTFIINEDTKIGYFASNRKGGKGNDDIYGFRQTEELITSCKQYIEGVISNSETNESLSGVYIVLLDSNGNTVTQTTSDDLGAYTFKVDCDLEYLIRVSHDNFNPREITVNTNDTFEFTHDVSIPLISLNASTLLLTTVEVNAGDDLAKTLQLEPIYFGLDDAEIRPETEIELQKIISALNKYPKLKIVVHSHTDSRSSYWYNKRLSLKRMRATVKYIVEQGGIYWRRVRGKAYGERRLLNNCANNVPCTEEEHQKNRRSEFIVRQ